MKPQLTSAFALFAMALTGCESMSAGQPDPTPQMSDADREAVSERKKAIIGALSAYEGVYDVSEAAMATAVLDEDASELLAKCVGKRFALLRQPAISLALLDSVCVVCPKPSKFVIARSGR